MKIVGFADSTLSSVQISSKTTVLSSLGFSFSSFQTNVLWSNVCACFLEIYYRIVDDVECWEWSLSNFEGFSFWPNLGFVSLKTRAPVPILGAAVLFYIDGYGS